jgi:hypothetical protein
VSGNQVIRALDKHEFYTFYWFILHILFILDILLLFPEVWYKVIGFLKHRFVFIQKGFYLAHPFHPVYPALFLYVLNKVIGI